MYNLYNFYFKEINGFDWSEATQGIILSSFYYGYIVTHLPGGMLAERFGGKYSLGFGVLSTAVFTLLTPWTVNIGGATGLIVLRIFEGLGEVSVHRDISHTHTQLTSCSFTTAISYPSTC
jgi:MFS transporter, ACS family, solute carrier family 17 (sodium-dependent inorganic phosphate cotransporter), other